MLDKNQKTTRQTPVNKLKKKVKALYRLAFYDEITNLPNQRYLESKLGFLTKQANGNPLVVFLIDIDDLNLAFELHSDGFAKNLMRRLVAGMKLLLDRDALLVHLEQHRFGIVQCHQSFTVAIGFADKLRAQIGQLNIGDTDMPWYATLSIGIAQHNLVTPPHSVAMLLKTASYACGQAKKNGGNCVVTICSQKSSQAMQ